MTDLINTAAAFRDIVSDASARLKAGGYGFPLNAYVASVREVAERLTVADLSSLGLDKLPAVILVRDYLETVQADGAGETRAEGVSVLVVTYSAADYTSEQREAEVYAPVLWPAVSAFLSAAVDAGALSPLATVQKIDRQKISGALNEVVLPATGRALFNDQLDGVELRGLTLAFDCNNIKNPKQRTL